MDLDKAIEKRKSVHNFKDKKVKWKNILDAVHTASQIPLAGNISNMKFVIVEDQETIQKIAKQAEQTWINQAQAIIVVCSEEKHLERMYGERGRVYCRQQAGASIQNLMLKLTDLDLASCWVGAYSDEDLRIMLKIPKEINIEAIIPIGYEKGKAVKKKKISLENLIYWEKWDKRKRSPFFKEETFHDEY